MTTLHAAAPAATVDGASTSWIDVPGGRLAAEATGDGPPIVLVHSAIVDRRAWAPVVPRLVDAGYRTIAYDLRGYHDSVAEDVAFAAHEDILAVIDHFGIGRAAIAGNSMGAIFALDAILAAPGRFSAYVWVGGGIGGWDKEPSSPEEEALFRAEGDAEDAGDWDLAAELDTRIWVDGWRDGVNQPPTRAPAAIRGAIRAMDRSVLEPGRVLGKRVGLDPPAVGRLDSVAVPTLVVIGELDTLGTRGAAEVVASEVPGARIERLPDVAHIVGMEAPGRLASLIMAHLDPLPRWS